MDSSSVVIVTGASAGMGKATAVALARTGARVVMLCRHRSRGEAALSEVRAQSGNNAVELMLCDLGSRRSIEGFCAEFKGKYDRLDVLVNNAGVVLPGRHETADGAELQFGVNHLGPFVLTNRLLELLTASAPSRIVNVASGAHVIGRIHFEDVNLTKNYRVWRAYAQSKLANILFTYELARRLDGTGVIVNCVHPGAVATSMGINRDTGFGKTIVAMLRPFFLTAEEGARTAVYLATSPDVEGVTGQYFYKKKPVATSRRSYDRQAARRLWELSARMTGLDDSHEENGFPGTGSNEERNKDS